MTPRWYFGWNIVAAAALMTLLSSGMRLSFSPFFLPIAHDLGFTRSTLSAIVAIGMLTYGLAMPVAGFLVARVGTRGVLVAGNVLVVGAVAWTVHAADITSFSIAFGLLLSVGLGLVSPVSLTPIISRWFTMRRGMALFFLSTGSMAGMALMTPVLSWAIAHLGWRSTLVGFAAAFSVITLPSALFVLREDAPAETDMSPADLVARGALKDVGRAGMSLGAALGTVPFWQICFGLTACGFSMNLLGTHGMPMLMDHGFDAFTSSMGIGLIGLVAIAGTLVLGRVADRLSRRHILATIYAVRGLGFLALVVVGTHWELYLTSTIGGLVWAGSIAMSSAILADVYGVKLVGVLYGLAYLAHQVGGMVAAWLGGWAFERFGTHWVSFGSAGALLFAAAVVSLQLPGRVRRMPPGAVPA